MLHRYLKIKVIVLTIIIMIFCVFLALRLNKIKERESPEALIRYKNMNDRVQKEENKNLIGGSADMNDKNMNYTSQAKESINQMSFIIVDIGFGNIQLLSSKENNIKVVESSDKIIPNDEKILATKKGNNLEFCMKKTNFNSIGLKKKKILLKVFIPEKYNKALELKSGFGDINLKTALNLKKIKLDSSAGNIRVESKIISDELYLNNDAGNVLINNLDSKNYDINLDAGNIDIKNLSGKGKILNSAGKIDCNIDKLYGNSKIEDNFGEIKLKVKDGSNINIDASSDFGRVKNNYKNDGGFKSKLLKVETQAGNVIVN